MGKTTNYSIRFDQDKLAFFKKRTPGINTPQQVVDELLNQFYYRHDGLWFSAEGSKEPTLPGTPLTVTLQTPLTTEKFAEEFKTVPPETKYEQYKKDILAANSPKMVETIAFIIKAEKDLTPIEKQQLQAFAVEHSRTFEF